MDLSATPVECSRDCGRKSTHVVKGCMDKEPVHLCEECLDRGIEVIRLAISLYQRLNKHIMVCGDCYRPLITLDTHITVMEL